ncbi:Amidophosphoribosyltransferase, chloroplastic [Capsicum annuum]|uniref:Amidophosphoribosyltransferase, chloroplastic n=2 Tax=Capsicum annuum TaxID=4072 RepID=A0A2G2ZN73_CAPAN|nr:Amidophosphoribosyltransferase, chloroplastic [Capsicum annuum]PHT83442.1 Amidophosphoribosyltransferase, chloroplastic [Capsicum annuum]
MATATAAVGAMNKPHISSPVDKPFCSPSQRLLSLSTKTLPKPYNHHRTLTTCTSKNPLTDVIYSGQTDLDGHSFGSYFDADDKPREECGVVGIGIVCVNDNVHKSITGVGLVSDVFSESKLDQLPGDLAIGHGRYSTAGASMLKNVQPFVASYRFGSVGVAHNGNLVNYKQLHGELEENGSIFNMSSDTEVVLHLISISKARPFLLRIVDACEKIDGAYSMVFATEDKLVAVRDPYGFRPLVMGKRSNGAIVFTSETYALDLIEATYERVVLPGLGGVALLSFKAAWFPKNIEHPYGHGKFETLGALGISGVLLATVGGIGWHASDVLLVCVYCWYLIYLGVYVFKILQHFLKVLWSAAPEVVNQSHLHMH